jgi:putative oxidoreductase
MDLASLILRLSLGIVFLAHGLQKTFGMFSGPGLNGFSNMLSGLGFKPALLWASVAAFIELIGGVCLVLGVFTKSMATLIMLLMVVAVLKVHLSKGFFGMAGGFEYNFLIISVCIALIILGTGKFGITNKF